MNFKNISNNLNYDGNSDIFKKLKHNNKPVNPQDITRIGILAPKNEQNGLADLLDKSEKMDLSKALYC